MLIVFYQFGLFEKDTIADCCWLRIEVSLFVIFFHSIKEHTVANQKEVFSMAMV